MNQIDAINSSLSDKNFPIYQQEQTVDLLEIVCQLRSQNQELLNLVLRGEQMLTDSQLQLQQQIQRSQKTEIALRQAQGEAAQLVHQLTNSQQETQQQQRQVENLAEQLAASQEHISQLEEHCLLLQQDSQNQAERCEELENQILKFQSILAVLRQENHASIAPSASPLSLTFELPDELPICLDQLPALPVDSSNWSLPILPPLTAVEGL